MDIVEAIDAVDAFIDSRLGKKRRGHSQRTAQLCRDLAPRFGIDPDAAYLAGLAHDMAKELDDESQLVLARRSRDRRIRSGIPLLPEMLLTDRRLTHGPAAESILRDDFAFDDESVLEAVSFHTSAALGLGPLAYLVYAADKIEPERSWIDRPFREECLSSSLKGMVLLILEKSMAGLTSAGKAIAPASLSLYNALRGQQQ